MRSRKRLGNLDDLSVALGASEIDRGADGDRTQVPRLLHRSKKRLIESVRIGKEFVVVDLCDKGNSVRIWQDHWVPTLPNCSINTQDANMKESDQRVSSLLSCNGGGWELNSIRPHIDDQMSEAILAIPIPRVPREDQLRWKPAINGVYSVKMGYHLTGVKPTVHP